MTSWFEQQHTTSLKHSEAEAATSKCNNGFKNNFKICNILTFFISLPFCEFFIYVIEVKNAYNSNKCITK